MNGNFTRELINDCNQNSKALKRKHYNLVITVPAIKFAFSVLVHILIKPKLKD